MRVIGEMAIVPPVEKNGEARALRDRWHDRRRRKPEPSDEERELASAAAAATTQPALPRERKRMRRIERRKRPTLPSDVSQPDSRRLAAVKGMAFALAAIVAFSLLPVLKTGNLNLATAPGWAAAALLLAVVQGFYIVWMLARPTGRAFGC